MHSLIIFDFRHLHDTQIPDNINATRYGTKLTFKNFALFQLSVLIWCRGGLLIHSALTWPLAKIIKYIDSP